jgi:type VI secretion system protein VasG
MINKFNPLISKLNPICRRAFEGVADLCVKQTYFSVEIEHLLSKLLEITDSDGFILLKYYDISLLTLRAELVRSLEKLKPGSTRTPAMSHCH